MKSHIFFRSSKNTKVDVKNFSPALFVESRVPVVEAGGYVLYL